MSFIQRALQLSPYHSKLLDALCLELAVNVPDNNSLSLLEILEMRRNNQINEEEFSQLYRGWLESKNVFDLFTAKQVRLYPKSEIISNQQLLGQLDTDTIMTYLEMLNNLYNRFYLARTKTRSQNDLRIRQTTEQIFDFLDTEGYIHIRLSQMFFISAALILIDGRNSVQNYEVFKPLFKIYNKQLSEVEGKVSLRWFKNYFIFKAAPQQSKQVLSTLKYFQKLLNNQSNKKSSGLPNIIHEGLKKWKNGSKGGLFDNKRKKTQIYQRIFQQNQQILFFSGGSDELILSEGYFIRIYGEEFVRSAEIDNQMLRQISSSFRQVLDEYISAIFGQKAKKVGSSSPLNHSSNQFTQLPNSSISRNGQSLFHNTSQKKPSENFDKKRDSIRNKTPTKKTKGNETRRFVVTPTNRNTRTPPIVSKQFGSTQKSLSKHRNSVTPTKQNAYMSMFQVGSSSMRNGRKEGVEKGSFYDKLFFFRNKRVESYEIVMKRLRRK